MTLTKSICRQNDEAILKNVIQRTKLIALLYDNFEPYSSDGHAAGPGKGAAVEIKNKISLRGLITNCSNAIRLQVSHFFAS